MIEVWKTIDGFDGIYQVSNLGRIKSIDRLVCSFVNKHRIKRGRILKPGTTPKGYHCVNLGKNETKKRLHRLIAEAFLPNPEQKETVNHINGIKTDNRVENLEWATYSENINHAYLTGLNFYKKERHIGHFKQVTATLPDGTQKIFISGTEAADYFGLAKTTISAYCRGVTKNSNGIIFQFQNK